MESKGIGVDVIVVEDGVFDQTADRIRSLPFSINHVAFEKNQGAQRARNHGLGLVRTETVMFLDSDDYIDEQLLQKVAIGSKIFALPPVKEVTEWSQ